jgi:hypothetical protein
MIATYKLVEASIEDIPVLVNHHRWMFEEIWKYRNLELDEQKLKDMDVAYKAKLDEEITNGICKAWILKDEKRTVASGAISIASMVPLPSDPSFQVAYLHRG